MTVKSHACTNYSVPSVENKRTHYSVHIFDRSEFLRFNPLYGATTLDAYASVNPGFCDTVQYFQRVPLRGETMWVQYPYQEILSVLLEYLEVERSTNPYEVRALLIVPQYESTRYDITPTKIQNLVKYYKLVHMYPPGTYLYSTLENSGYSTKENQIVPLRRPRRTQ